MPSRKKATEPDELDSLLMELNRKTGIEFSIKKPNPAGREETLLKLKSLLNPGDDFRDKNDFLKKALTGETGQDRLYEGMRQFHMEESGLYQLWLAETGDVSDENAEYILKSIFHTPAAFSVLRTDRTHIALLKNVKPDDAGNEAGLKETAQTIYDMLSAEALLSADIAYSMQARKIGDLPDSFRETSMALKIGRIFYAQNHIFPCNRLGIARLVYELPVDVCRKYLAEVFGEKEPEDFDEETVHIISVFFENGLNISEAARQLYMHRNTLVYRLEKISRSSGLDIRNFDDAVTYKIATMIQEYIRYKTKNPN
jgi:carbohydrate diacid regulator